MKTTLSAISARIVQFSRSRWINKFTLAFIGFLVWITLFDKHNLITQWHLRSTVCNLESEIEGYALELEQVRLEKKHLQQDPEKYAREKYLMHKENEDVFLIETDRE